MFSNQHERWRRGAAWLAPLTLIAAGVAGVGAATAASASTHSTGRLQVCQSGRHGMAGRTGTFTVKGRDGYSKTQNLKPVGHGLACGSVLRVAKGNYSVSQSAKSGVKVLNIKVSPTASAKIRNIGAGMAKAAVTRSHRTRVTFVNKVKAVVAPAPSPSPTETETATPTPTPTVTITPTTSPTSTAVPTPTPTITSTDPGTGYIEVCKYSGDRHDSWVEDGQPTGGFSITINDGSFSATQPVPVGQCTGPIQVPAGTATVSEAPVFPFALTSVTTNPATDLVAANLAGGSAQVTVVASADSSTETKVNLFNSTRTAQFKICKTLTANSGDLVAAGDSTFDFSSTVTFAGDTWDLRDIDVTVPSLQQQACVVYPYPLPLGSQVSVTEDQGDSPQNTVLTGVSVQPASQDNGSSLALATAKLIIGPNDGGFTAAEFTDLADGTIEICKQIDDSQWLTREYKGGGEPQGLEVREDGSPYDGTPFSFSVNGGSPITVDAGECSGPIIVPAGTATVSEVAQDNFNLEGFTAVGPDGTSRLVSGSNPITVNVPWGGESLQGIGNETLVTATNRVDVGRIKVCKVLDVGVPVGKTFDFDTTVDSGTTSDAWFGFSSELTPTADGAAGEVCSGLSSYIPVVQPYDGTDPDSLAPTTFTTTEGDSPFPGTTDDQETVEPTSITYGGNGDLTDSKVFVSGDTESVDDGTYYGTADLGQGINALTFLNSIVVDP
jgi:hypothetical protein